VLAVAVQMNASVASLMCDEVFTSFSVLEE